MAEVSKIWWEMIASISWTYLAAIGIAYLIVGLALWWTRPPRG